MEISAFDLEIAIHNHVSSSNCISFSNVFLWGNFESDYIKITGSGYIYEYEIKMSKQDFKKDFEKYNYFANNKKKHDMILSGESGLKGFSFVVPENLISIDEIPQYSGLYYIVKSDRNTFSVNCVKEPPILKAKKIDDKKREQLLMKTYYKYSEIQRMERLTRIYKWTDGQRNEQNERSDF